MKKAIYYLGIMPYNGEPSRVWLVLGSLFFAWSTVRNRIQVDISWFCKDNLQIDEGEKEKFENLDLSL